MKQVYCMKLSADQKKMLKAIAVYVVLFPVGMLFFGWLFNKQASWEDAGIAFLTSIILGLLFAVATIYGARVPEKSPQKESESPAHAEADRPSGV